MGKTTTINIRGLRGDQRAKELEGLDLSKVILLAIDTARDFPKALIFDYFGGVLEKSFFFAVNNEDMVALHEKVQYWVDCVKAERVFVGIEVAGCYHNAIADALEKLGYEVSLVNSYTTSCERKKMLDYSKTDDKDLRAIGQAVIANNGLSAKRVTGYYEQMQLVCRTRRQLVTEASVLKSQIRQLMTVLFREFQGLVDPSALQKQKIFKSFWNRESRMIMHHCPLPDEILQLGEIGLQQLAAAEKTRLTDREIELLIKAARRALSAPSTAVARFQSEQVQFRLKQLEDLEEQITALEFQMEDFLVKTPAILLLTIKGINVVTAAEFIAEIGVIFKYTYNRQLVKLAGINPVLSQSGGKKIKAYQISRQGNPALRYIVGVIGRNLCSKNCRNTYFMDYYERLAQRGKAPCQIYIAAANKFIRIAFAMLQNQTPFHVPGFEECTSDIAPKLTSEKNRQMAKQAVELLTAL